MQSSTNETCPIPVYIDPTRPLGERLEDLLSRMTLEEKLAQLGSVWANELLQDGKLSVEKARRIMPHGLGQITRVGGAGKLGPRESAEAANEIQKFLECETRLRIPAIMHEECLSGLMAKAATVFPQAIGWASAWDPALVRESASIIRAQMVAIGAHQGLAPLFDVVRDPRWGRVEETYGEDPYLVASIGVAYVMGLQGDDGTGGIMATLKHFVGYACSEGGRNLAPVHLSDRELRDVFLWPFEAAVKEGKARSLMNAYHDIGGVPCTASRELLTDILRSELGFDGVVVSDYGAIEMLQSFHLAAESKKDSATQAIEAGIDVELPGVDCYGEPLAEAVREGSASLDTVDEAVRRHLRQKFGLGLFEHRYVETNLAPAVFDTPVHRQTALRLAEESLVLLKNENGLLPLSRDRTASIAVVGPSAASARNLLGDYTFMAHTQGDESTRIVTILDGIHNVLQGAGVIRHAEGCDISGSSKEGFAEALDAVNNSDVAVVVVGERSGLSPEDTVGEGRDRADIGLPGVQEDLVEAICETGKPVIVVLVNGRPLSIEWIASHAPAIIEAWLPGEEGGNAVARVLFGEHNPAGRLPISFPRSSGQIPVHYSRAASSCRDYVATDSRPLFPFGHGLSYTTFTYSNLAIELPELAPGGEVLVEFDLANDGHRRGDDVVQLYVRDPIASVVRPCKELKGFARVTLDAGETRRIHFALPTDLLAFHDRQMYLVVEPGTFQVMIGSSSDDIRLTGRFELVGSRSLVRGAKSFFTRVS